MTTDTQFAEARGGLNADSLAALCDVLTLARDLGPGKSTAFMTECRAALDAPFEGPASELLAPVLARWAGQVQS